MKQLFLRFFFIGKELNVVHDQNVILSVFFFKTIYLVRLNRVYVVDREFFRGRIVYFLPPPHFFNMVSDRLDEVCFSKPCFSVNKKRIVCRTKLFYNRLRSSVSKLVERADNKRVEQIPWVQVVFFVYIQIIKRRKRCSYGLPHFFMRPLQAFFVWLVVFIYHVFKPASALLGHTKSLENEFVVFIEQPILDEFIRNPQKNRSAVALDNVGIFKPSAEVRLRYTQLNFYERVFPKLFVIKHKVDLRVLWLVISTSERWCASFLFA